MQMQRYITYFPQGGAKKTALTFVKPDYLKEKLKNKLPDKGHDFDCPPQRCLSGGDEAAAVQLKGSSELVASESVASVQPASESVLTTGEKKSNSDLRGSFLSSNISAAISDTKTQSAYKSILAMSGKKSGNSDLKESPLSSHFGDTKTQGSDKSALAENGEKSNSDLSGSFSNNHFGDTKTQAPDGQLSPLALSQIKRGELYYADLSPVVGSEQGGIRPILIVQNDIGNKHSPTIIAAAITSQITKAKLPTHIEIEAGEFGLLRHSVILCEQIRTLDKRRLKEKIGALDKATTQKVDRALLISLGFGF